MCLLADLLLQLVILRSLSVIETCWHAVEQKTLSWAVLVHDIKTISLLFTTSWQTDIHLISPGFFFSFESSQLDLYKLPDWLINFMYLFIVTSVPKKKCLMETESSVAPGTNPRSQSKFRVYWNFSLNQHLTRVRSGNYEQCVRTWHLVINNLIHC